MSQETAQQTVTSYLQRTVDQLPQGAHFDVITPGVRNVPCKEDYLGTVETILYEDVRWIVAPQGLNNETLTAELDRIWRGFGWTVMPNDEHSVTPNLSAYPGDGYRVLLGFGGRNSDKPTISSASTCYPIGDSYKEIIPPRSITQS